MLELNHGFCIESDKYQFILKETYIAKKKDTGESYETERNIAYYSDLNRALNGYLDVLAMNKVADEDLTVKELIDYLKQQKEDVGL